jgi:hypothetical protein
LMWPGSNCQPHTLLIMLAMADKLARFELNYKTLEHLRSIESNKWLEQADEWFSRDMNTFAIFMAKNKSDMNSSVLDTLLDRYLRITEVYLDKIMAGKPKEEPAREPTKETTKEPTREPTQEKQKEPAREEPKLPMAGSQASIVANYQTITQSNVTIIGNNNIIVGNNNNITGNYNNVKGNNNNITGNYNKVEGNNNKMVGNHNNITGNHNTANGSYNKENGKENSMTDSSNATIMVNGTTFTVSNGTDAPITITHPGTYVTPEGTVTFGSTTSGKESTFTFNGKSTIGAMGVFTQPITTIMNGSSIRTYHS